MMGEAILGPRLFQPWRDLLYAQGADSTCMPSLLPAERWPALLRQLYSTLQPGERVAMTVWGDLDTCPIFCALDAILREVGASGAAAKLAAPFRVGNAAVVERLVRDAGFTSVNIDAHKLDLVLEGGLGQALAALAETPASDDVAALPDSARVGLVAAAERHLSMLGDTGAVRAPMLAHVAVATR
jgi:hypothetical protein